MTLVRTAFDVFRHSFAFGNRFAILSDRRLPWRLSPVVYGLCGGMAYAALDYYHAGQEPTRASEVPATGSPLWWYLWRRQLATLACPPTIVPRVLYWMQRSDEWVAGRSARIELARARQAIDRGQPPVLLLLRAAGLSSPTRNHQAVAVGYEELGDDLVRLLAYDPNWPEREVEILVPVRARLGEPPRQSTGEALRGFFLLPYRPRCPPPDLR
jgi:hypothetical protein